MEQHSLLLLCGFKLCPREFFALNPPPTNILQSQKICGLSQQQLIIAAYFYNNDTSDSFHNLPRLFSDSYFVFSLFFVVLKVLQKGKNSPLIDALLLNVVEDAAE